MRACLSLLLMLALASVGSQPPVAFSQPQTISGGNPPCVCPQIPAVATSDKPDPRKSPNELTFADLEQWLSNREALYGGDWDKALLALAHDIDPTGELKIWTRPAPAPSNRSVRIQEGYKSDELLGRPLSARRGQARPRVYANLGDVIETIARINKYGEPAFGLRKALIRTARFLAYDLGNVPRYSSAAQGGNAVIRARVGTTGSDSRNALHNVLDFAAALSERHPDAVLIEQRRAKEASDSNHLFLDAYDYANAALDIILSVDEKGNQDGIRGLRTATGVDYYYFELEGLVALAGTRGVFGGSASVGSPADAVACKAFTILATLADMPSPNGVQFRRLLFNRMEYWGFYRLVASAGAPRTPTRSVQPTRPPTARVPGGIAPPQPPIRRPDFGIAGNNPLPSPGVADARSRAARAALIHSDIREEDDAAKWADRLFSDAVGSPWILGSGFHGTVNNAMALATIRDIEQYAKGAGKPAFVRAIEQKFDNERTQLEKDTEREKTINTNNQKMGMGAVTLPERVAREQFLNAWQAATTDYNPVNVEPLACPPAGATPRVIIFAKGVNGRIIIKKLYVGVPTTLGLTFPEPYDGDQYPVRVQTGGGTLSLTARPIDGKHLLFETEEFVITSK